MKTHYIISFDLNVPIIMEQVLEFCKQWLLVFASGKRAVLAIHPDGYNGSQNMHIHMLINSIRKYAGKNRRFMTSHVSESRL